MSRSPLEYLRHALDEMTYLVERTQGLTQDRFLQDATLQRAFVRSLEIIGEAVKNVPDDFRQRYGYIDWRAIAGMRDRLIHGYFDVDLDVVWSIATRDLLSFVESVESILG